MCQTIEQNHEAMHNRISKLERSRGQINKDIHDMLRDVQEWKRQESAKDGKSEAPMVIKQTSTTEILPEPVPQAPKTPSANSNLDPPLGLTIRDEQVNGETVHHVTWRLEKSKFKDCVNRPLVSQHFQIQGKELKLMVSLGTEDQIAGLNTKDLKAKMEALVAYGPLTGSVKLKAVADVCERLYIKFRFFVGSVRQEQHFFHDFGERVTFESKFDNDWLQEFVDGSLVVGCDIMSIQEEREQAVGAPPGLEKP